MSNPELHIPKPADTREVSTTAPASPPEPLEALVIPPRTNPQPSTISRKVQRATKEFVAAARELFTGSIPKRDAKKMPMRQAENIADKFFNIKRELQGSNQGAAVYADKRIHGMFYAKQFFPQSWDTLDAKQRIQAITLGLPQIESDMQSCLRSSRGRPLRNSTTRARQENDTPDADNELTSSEASSPDARGTSENVLASQPSSSTAEVGTSLRAGSTVHERIPPFRLALLSTHLSSLSIPLPSKKNWTFTSPRPVDVLDLLNLPADELLSWIHTSGVGLRTFSTEMACLHPGVALLFSSLEELGISRFVANQLRSQRVFQSKHDNGGLTTDRLAPMRRIDNGFRLLTSPLEYLDIVPDAQRNLVRLLFLEHGFMGRQKD